MQAYRVAVRSQKQYALCSGCDWHEAECRNSRCGEADQVYLLMCSVAEEIGVSHHSSVSGHWGLSPCPTGQWEVSFLKPKFIPES
jgi:hypothetical protein